MKTNPRRQHMRNRLFLVGLLPLLLSLLFFGKVALMVSAQAAGTDAYDSDDFGKAAKEFAGNQTLNHLESWISPFNEGAAKHRDEEYDAALEKYDEALDDVPDDEECSVRTNMALAHESIGDAALEGEDTPTAIKSWKDGIEVLAGADCPTDAAGGDEQTEKAAAVDARLRQKVAEQEASEEKDPKDNKDKKKQQREKQEIEKKKEKIEKRNAEGRQERAEREDYEDYPYSGSYDGPQW